MKLEYDETATFVVALPTGYAKDQTYEALAEVPVIFEQSVGYGRNNHRDDLQGDSIVRPDPEDEFILDHFMRLEGMYVKISPFGSPETKSWFRIIRATVFRDTLLKTEIDNIECLLIKVPEPTDNT